MRFKRLTVAFLLVMFAVVLVVEPLPVHAASSLVQQKSTLRVSGGGNIPPDSTISASFSSSVASGNVIVVAVEGGNGVTKPPATVDSVDDSIGSSFIQAVYASYGGMHAYIYYATLGSSGADTVTVTFSTDLDDLTGWAYLFIYEVSGVTTGGATATGSGTISNSGSVSTSSSITFENGAFLVAIMGTDIISPNWVAGSGFQFSPTPNGDQFIRQTKTMYSTSGVSSPTDFPATLSRLGYSLDWVEVGIALNPPSTLSIEDPITHLNTLNVAVGSSFSVDIWIRNLPTEMVSFSFDLDWDPALMQYDHSVGNAPSGWEVDVDDAGSLHVAGHILYDQGQPIGQPYGDDRMWLSVYFRCLKSGVGTIEISGSSWMDYVGGFTLSFDSVLSATVSQTGGSTPNPYHYVGGELFTANKLAVLSPYLALIAVVAVASIVAKRKFT